MEMESESELIDISLLKEIKSKIQTIDPHYHKDFFNIFKSNGVRYSSNKNGIFINISNIDSSVYEQVNELIEHIENQEKILNDVEKEKEHLEASLS